MQYLWRRISVDLFIYGLNNPSRYTDPTDHAADAGGSTAPRWEDLYKAYKEVAERTSYNEYHGQLKEYLSTVAAYYYARSEGCAEDIEAEFAHVEDRRAALLINGFADSATALSTAVDAGLIIAPEFVAQTGTALAGGLDVWQPSLYNKVDKSDGIARLDS